MDSSGGDTLPYGAKPAQWLKKENDALLQENSRLRAMLETCGIEGLTSTVEHLRTKLSLAMTELESHRRSAFELEAARRCEHQAQLESTLTAAAAEFQENNSSHESTTEAALVFKTETNNQKQHFKSCEACLHEIGSAELKFANGELTCTACGESLDTMDEDGNAKRSVQEILLDIENEKDCEIDRLRKLLNRFQNASSRHREGQHVRAVVKMKWRKDGKQMTLSRIGCTFKVDSGVVGRIHSVEPLCVAWSNDKHGDFLGEVAVDQVEVIAEQKSHNTPGSIVQGSVVRLQGLDSGHLLNGQQGTCEEWDDAAGRWRVRLDVGKTLAVKPGNLKLASEPGWRLARNSF